MAKEKTERQVDFMNRFGAPYQWLTAITIGLGSSYVTLNNLVQEKFHEHMMNVVKIKDKFLGDKERGAGKDLSTLHEKKAALSEGIVQNSPEGRKFAREMAADTHNAKGALRAYEDWYAGDKMKLANGPIGRRSPLGIWQRSGFVSRESQWLIAFKTLFALGAGTGVTLMAFNQLNTRDKLNDMNKSDAEMNLKLDKLITRQATIGDAIKKDEEPLFEANLEEEKKRTDSLKHGGHAKTIEAKRAKAAELASEPLRT